MVEGMMSRLDAERSRAIERLDRGTPAQLISPVSKRSMTLRNERKYKAYEASHTRTGSSWSGVSCNATGHAVRSPDKDLGIKIAGRDLLQPPNWQQ